jgi:hypothetical protein
MDFSASMQAIAISLYFGSLSRYEKLDVIILTIFIYLPYYILDYFMKRISLSQPLIFLQKYPNYYT